MDARQDAKILETPVIVRLPATTPILDPAVLQFSLSVSVGYPVWRRDPKRKGMNRHHTTSLIVLLVHPCPLQRCCLPTVLASLWNLYCKQSLNYPVEPFLEELEREDTMEFSPPPEAPVEEDAVIPPHVLDALLEAPEEEARASLEEVW